MTTYPVDKPGDKHFLQPRSQGSLLPAVRSVGRVGENPGNEVALSPLDPLDTYESYNSTTNVSGVLPTRQASKFLRPLNVLSTVHSVWWTTTFSTRTTRLPLHGVSYKQDRRQSFPGRCPWEFLVGLCRPVLQILTRFQTKKCYSPHPFSD